MTTLDIQGSGSLKKHSSKPNINLYQVNEMVSQLSEAAATSSDYTSENDIVVHVIDQGHGITRDFLCSKQKVMMKMKYFQGYFSEKNSKIEELDISVHCDVNIFDWLVRYLQDPTEPKLELKNIISVLISSEFLGIDDLVEKCLVFVSKHLEEVVKLPIEMSCLSASLIERLAVKVGLTDLATLQDPKDKLSSKLYQRKLT